MGFGNFLGDAISKSITFFDSDLDGPGGKVADDIKDIAKGAFHVAKQNPAGSFIESFVDTVRDSVTPEIGSIIYCDLHMGLTDHSGVYVGNGEIVHLNGNGDIEIVDTDGFMANTSAMNIYVSCEDENAVGAKYIAKRARNVAGGSEDYNFILNNCHQFTSGCITGAFENSDNFLWMLKDKADAALGCNTWRHWDLE